MQKFLLAIYLVIAVGSPLRAEEIISVEKVPLLIAGEILDTDLGLKSESTNEPLWFAITKLDVRAKSIVVETSEPLKPLFVHAMNRLTKKANVRLIKEVLNDESLQELFKLHRKTGGFGVHGPLNFKGRLLMKFQVYATRTRLVLELDPQEFSGPNGEWKK